VLRDGGLFMSEVRCLSAQEFVQAECVSEGAILQGRDLQRVLWMLRGLQKELARKEKFWAATNDNLASAYRTLEERSDELRKTREELVQLNQSLEQRVAAQVDEIVQRARQIEALNLQLQQKVHERSRELAMALRRLSENRRARALGPGDVFAERARVRRVLGQGGMGTVYLCDDLLTGQPIAVKLMHQGLGSDSAVLHRFFVEATAASAISHPGVVKTLHVDVTSDGQVYQIMEFVDGIDLATRAQQAALSMPACARIGATLAAALAAAHQKGVVHRDLKPSNVLLTRGGPGVRILDFGISKVLGDEDGVLSMTRTSQLMGTPQYMSPEQVRDASSVTAASDVYSLGVMLFELISGRPPFVGESLGAICAAHLYEQPPSLQALYPQVPESLALAVMLCLEKSPSLRPTAAELACALSALADAMAAPSAETFFSASASPPVLAHLATLAQ